MITVGYVRCGDLLVGLVACPTCELATRQFAAFLLIRTTANILQRVANLLCVQANSASYPLEGNEY